MSREELAALVSAFRARLAWARDHGAVAVPAAPSPRTLPHAGAAETAVGPEPEAGPALTTVGPAPAPAPRPAVAPRRASPTAPPTAPAVETPALPPRSLEDVRRLLGDCQRCGLGSSRKRLVFGVGDPRAELLFVGEAPGHDEDVQGEPFVGAAGQLLTRMIEAMGLTRDEVYIANIIKCRPPQNRDPSPDEIDACERFLLAQIDVIQPKIIVALGNFAAKTLLRTEKGITQLRGRFHTYHGIPLMPTFHPAYLLRSPEQKRPVWEDLKQVMAEMDRRGLRRRRGR